MEKKTITLVELNQTVRESLDAYYKNHDADSFFAVDHMLKLCKMLNLTSEEVPAMIEMQNVIVMG